MELKENIGKSSYEMRQFFQEMIKTGKLKAYNVELNKQVIEKNTDEEEVIRIKKGATLTPTEKLSEYRPVFVEDLTTSTIYHLNIGSRGGMFFNDGDSQTIYHHCVLERIVQGFDPKKINSCIRSNFEDGISIPPEMVTARLRISYDQDWESGGNYDYIEETRGNLIVDGEQDSLFAKVMDFVRN